MMTDNEIKKALECCGNIVDSTCKGCVYHETYNASCVVRLMRDALDLIKRLEAKNKEFDERLLIYKGTVDWQVKEINRKDAEIEQLRDLVIEGGREQDRLMAEIERLTSQKMSREQDRDYWMAQTRIARDNITFAKSEAINEFWRRLRNYAVDIGDAYIVVCGDDLVKEMTNDFKE